MADDEAAAPPAGEENDSVAIRQGLYDAAREGDLARVRDALNEGANVNSLDPWGLPPLQSAAVAGHTDIAALLLDRRAAVDALSSVGKSALHVAASAGHIEVVKLLISRGGDVLLQTGHGSTPLDLAKLDNPRGPCTQAIVDEIARRLRDAEDITMQLRRRLESTDSIRKQLRVQLSQAPESMAPSVHVPEELSDPSTGPPTGYWAYAASEVERFRTAAERGAAHVSLRVPRPGNEDAFPWTGEHVAKGDVLPILDPNDAELNESFYRLGLAVEDRVKRLGRGSAEEAAAADPDGDRRLIEQTGKDMGAWEKVILQLRAPGCRWDWSKVGVRDEQPEGLPEGVGGYPVAFAQQTNSGDKCAPVFRHQEIIGPFGGTLFRRARYEQHAYASGGKLSVHDPSAYEFKLKAKTPELRLETFVLDITIGNSANRLRHFADPRSDPLRVGKIFGGPGADGVFAPADIVLPERKYGGAMPRPRSRPSSAHHGDGGAAAAAAVEQRVEEAEQAASEEESSLEAAEEEEIQQHAEATNAIIVEVLVQGWPYAFLVASRDIHAGESICVDRGASYWALQRAKIARIQAMGRIGKDLVAGVDLPTKEERGETGEGESQPWRPPLRRPMPRPKV